MSRMEFRERRMNILLNNIQFSQERKRKYTTGIQPISQNLHHISDYPGYSQRIRICWVTDRLQCQSYHLDLDARQVEKYCFCRFHSIRSGYYHS